MKYEKVLKTFGELKRKSGFPKKLSLKLRTLKYGIQRGGMFEKS